MKFFDVTGFSKSGVWQTIRIKTILECVEKRAHENGIAEILNIEEVEN